MVNTLYYPKKTSGKFYLLITTVVLWCFILYGVEDLNNIREKETSKHLVKVERKNLPLTARKRLGDICSFWKEGKQNSENRKVKII